MECRAFHIAAAAAAAADDAVVALIFVTVVVANIDFDCVQTIEAIADDVMWMLATSTAIVLSRWQNALAAAQAIMTHHVLSLGIRIVVIAVMVDIAIYVELVKVVSSTATTTSNAGIISITIAVMKF
uniref:Uncharacterized protein n=1 Tax=Glossina pallidipes TaxID=7398 RepID=A0A1A9Z3P0_GLOPL